MCKLVVLVIDTNSERGKTMALSLHNGGVETYWHNNDGHFKVPCFYDAVDFPEEISLLLLHNSNKGLWENLQNEGMTAKTIVRYTGDDASNFNETEYWIRKRPMKNQEDATLSEDETKGLLQWVQDVIDGKQNLILPDLLIPLLSFSFITALSILCQGYLAVHPNTNLNTELRAYLPEDVSQKITKTKDPQWWKEPFTNKTQDTLTQKITREWQPENLPQEVIDLINAIYGDKSINVDIVQNAYNLIVPRLTSL